MFLFCVVNFMLPAWRPNFAEVFPTAYDVEQAPSTGMRCQTVSRWVPATGGSCCLHLLEQYLEERGYRFLKADLTPNTASKPRRQTANLIQNKICQYVRQGMGIGIYVT